MILLRHGQSEFNLHFGATRRDPGIIDPRLTPLGHTQAEQAAQQLMGQGIQRIIVSPYSRALQTARPVAAALNVCRSPSTRSCGSGSPSPATSARPAPTWNATGQPTISPTSKTSGGPQEEEPEAAIVDRAARFRTALAERHDWANTLVISHWGFILSLTGQSVANGQWLRCDPTEPAPERLVWRA